VLGGSVIAGLLAAVRPASHYTAGRVAGEQLTKKATESTQARSFNVQGCPGYAYLWCHGWVGWSMCAHLQQCIGYDVMNK
jgi:hypothetical protein